MKKYNLYGSTRKCILYQTIIHFMQASMKVVFALIYMAVVALYDTHRFEWPFLQKYKNIETICIPNPKYCLYTRTYILNL